MKIVWVYRINHARLKLYKRMMYFVCCIQVFPPLFCISIQCSCIKWMRIYLIQQLNLFIINHWSYWSNYPKWWYFTERDGDWLEDFQVNELLMMMIIIILVTMMITKMNGDDDDAWKRPGGHCHWKLYHIRVNRPQKSTLNEDSRVDQKTWANFHILNEDDCCAYNVMLSYTLNQECFHTL